MLFKLYLSLITKKNGGASINKQYNSPKRGYMVAVKNFENMADMLANKLEHNQYYGTWLDVEDNNKLYCDISTNIIDYKEAVDLAKKRGELAIYDVAQGCSIYV